MRLIVVTGMPGSGKEEFLTVASSMSIPFVRMGDVVREAYAVRGDEDRDLSVGQFAARERERFGANIWARRARWRTTWRSWPYTPLPPKGTPGWWPATGMTLRRTYASSRSGT